MAKINLGRIARVRIQRGGINIASSFKSKLIENCRNQHRHVLVNLTLTFQAIYSWKVVSHSALEGQLQF